MVNLPDRDRGQVRSDRSRAGPVHDGKDPAPKSLRDQSSPRYYTAVLRVEISKCEYKRKGKKKEKEKIFHERDKDQIIFPSSSRRGRLCWSVTVRSATIFLSFDPLSDRDK